MRSFAAFDYAAGSWNRERRVVARLEASARGFDARYIVTSLGGEPRHLYEGTPASTVTFAAGSAEARLRLATDDDEVAEADAKVTASVVAGSGYGVDANASAATVDVYDNDEAASTAVETLWTSTLTVESIGGVLLGTTDPDAVVAAGPGVSVADAQVQEAEGAALAFRVTLDTAQTSVVSVRYATSDGTATVARSGTGVSSPCRRSAASTCAAIRSCSGLSARGCFAPVK